MAHATNLTLGGSSRLGLLFAGLLAALTGVLVYVAVDRASGNEGPADASSGPLTLVVRASQDIPARTTITSDMIEEVRVPENALLAGAFSGTDLVEGRVARIPIYEGEQLVQEKLATTTGPKSDNLGLSFVVPAGMRAMAVGVDKVVGAGGNIQPGDRVDVVAVVEITYEDVQLDDSVDFTRSVLIAQNVEVLAVEQELQNRPATTADKKDGTFLDQPDAQPDGEVVTLSLTPEQMQQVFLADEAGAIRLAVRAPGDTEIQPLPSFSPLGFVDAEYLAALKQALATRKDANR